MPRFDFKITKTFTGSVTAENYESAKAQAVCAWHDELLVDNCYTNFEIEEVAGDPVAIVAEAYANAVSCPDCKFNSECPHNNNFASKVQCINFISKKISEKG